MKPLLRREQAWTDAKSRTKRRESTYGGVFTIAPNETNVSNSKIQDPSASAASVLNSLVTMLTI